MTCDHHLLSHLTGAVLICHLSSETSSACSWFCQELTTWAPDPHHRAPTGPDIQSRTSGLHPATSAHHPTYLNKSARSEASWSQQEPIVTRKCFVHYESHAREDGTVVRMRRTTKVVVCIGWRARDKPNKLKGKGHFCGKRELRGDPKGEGRAAPVGRPGYWCIEGCEGRVFADPWYGPKITWGAMCGVYGAPCMSGNVTGSLGFCVAQEKKNMNKHERNGKARSTYIDPHRSRSYGRVRRHR